MSVFKPTTKNTGAKYTSTTTSNQNKPRVFTPTARRGMDERALRDLRATNRQALEVINEYNKRMNADEWMPDGNRKQYNQAVDAYISSSNKLRKYNTMMGHTYSNDDNEQWRKTVAGLKKGVADAESLYSQYKDEKDFGRYLEEKKAYEKAQREYDDSLKLDTEKAKREIASLTNILGINAQINDIDREAATFKLAVAKGDKNAAEKLKKLQERRDLLAKSWAEAESIYGSYNDINALLNEKTRIYNIAVKNQGAEKLKADAEAMQNSANFGELAFMGSTAKNNRFNQNAEGEKWSTGEMLRDAANSDLGNSSSFGEKASSNANAKMYDLFEKYGTEDERRIYDAYIGAREYDKAEAYYNYLVDLYNQKAGADKYSKYNSTILEPITQFAGGVEGGILGIANATLGLAGKDPVQYTTANQYAQGMMRQDDGFVWGTINDLAATTGNMMPSIAVGMLNPTAGAITMGLSAGGNKYVEMVEKGYGREQALMTGAAIGALEAVTSKLLSGIGALGGAVTNKAVARAVDGMSSGVARFFTKWGLKMGGEAVEEGLQSVFEPLVENAILGTDNKVDWGEVAYSALLGALSAGVLEGGPLAADTISEARAAKAKYGSTPQRLVSETLEIDPEYRLAQKMQKRLDAGKKVSGANLAAMARQNKYVARTGDLTPAKKSKASTRATETADVTENAPTDERGSEAKISPSVKVKNAEGKTVNAEIRGVEVEDGKATFTLDNGEKVSVDKATYQNADQRYVAEGAIERVSYKEGFTTEAATAMIKGYDGSVKPKAYETAFDVAFEMGRNGVASSKLASAINLGLNESVAFAAYDLGRNSVLQNQTKSDILNTNSTEATNESESGLYLRQGVQRNNGQNTEEQVSAVEGGAGEVSGRGDTSRSTADVEAARLVDQGRVVRVSDLGIPGGSQYQTVVRLDGVEETADMKAARREAEAQGKTVRFFAGDNLLIENKYGKVESVRAFIYGDYVYVRADHSEYTSKQLMGHELGHDKIAKGEVDPKAVKKRLIEKVGKENVDKVTEAYAKAYANTGYDTDEVWEEMICDSLGDMNVFAKSEVVGEYVEAMQGNIKESVNETQGKATNETRELPDINQLATDIYNAIPSDLKRRGVFTSTKALLSELLVSDRDAVVYDLNTAKRAYPTKDFQRRADSLIKKVEALGNKVEGKASLEFSSPEEAKESGKISDARFSIEFADDIANRQRAEVVKGLSRISSEELEKAISDTARMVNEMKPYANILPQDKVGKTLVKNGSYDVSVENTTVCIRTLAYNAFVDMVSEKVGRPLTQMESFLVSQKLYEIAKEPQCLYCYVSLDRKAFNEMVIRYTEQRDAAIEAYKAAGEPAIPKSFNENWALFKEFLDGRKPTQNMWDRYTGWLKAYNNGERLVSLSDISTEAKRLALVESDGMEAAQVKDILKYAQSASWAKKQTQYVAYNSEILKLKPQVIRNLNSHYGMRWYSFSDYSGAFIVENMQQITDAAVKGLKGLSYTKDTDFVEIFAPTGMNINISVYAKKGANGYEIDPKQSADINKAIELRKKYPNVGIVVVATDAEGVNWALEQEWSDVVIPFHTVRTGADVAEFYNWEIFNTEQNDTVADQNLWDEYVKSLGKKKVSKMVYPSEHQNNLDTYLKICKERGLTPRFKSFLDNPNYMKLVNETRQSESQTTPLKAKFDVDAAIRSFDKFVEKGGYYEGWYNDGIDVDAEADIVASDVLAGKKANEVNYGRQDVNFEDIAKGRKTNRQHGKASAEMSDEDYYNYGWVRENNIISAGHWKSFTSNFADALKRNYKFDKTPDGEFMIEAYNYYDPVSAADVVVFAKGTIESPIVTRIAKINNTKYIDIDAKRSVLYETERRGVSPKTGDIFRFYYKTDFTGELKYRRTGDERNRDNNQLGVKRSRSEITSNPIVEFHIDEEQNTVTTTYRNGETIVENLGKASQELDLIDYINEQAKAARNGNELRAYKASEKMLQNRQLLANALESINEYPSEKGLLSSYRATAERLQRAEQRIAEIETDIAALSKDEKNAGAIAMLKREQNTLKAEIHNADKQLLNLEAAKPLKRVLELEKQKVEQEYRKKLDEMRERASEKLDKTVKEYQEARAKSVEGRHKTAERHAIRKIAKDLEKLLNRGTKERNVKKGERALVERLLDITDRLFATDDELLLSGIVTDTSAKEKSAIAEYMALYEEYHSYDDAASENKEIRKELRQKMTEVKHDFAEALERERNRINEAQASDAFDALIKEYKALKGSKEEHLAGAYKAESAEFLETLKETVGDTTIKNMSLKQLQSLHTALTLVKHTISDSNKIFRNGRRESLEERKNAGFAQINNLNNKFNKDYNERIGKLLESINTMGWNNLRPVDAFELLDSEALMELYWDVLDAQNHVYASDIEEFTKKLVSARQKYGYKKWGIEDSKTFKTDDGRDFALTLGERMSIYAYSKREQAEAHMREGGFQREKGAIYKDEKGIYRLHKKESLTYKIGDKFRLETIASNDFLTKEQRAYVDEMQALLTEWGNKGNEASNIVYGIDLFTESVYFPLVSSSDYLSSVQNELGKTRTTASLSASGMTKPTVPGANNPIMLRSFDDVVMEHIDKMSKYHAYLVPIENLRKMLDAQGESSNGNMLSMRALIGEKLGDGAKKYFQDYITDLNGAPAISGAKSPLASFFSKSKAVKVLGNISVWIQQWFSVIRASAEINPKYLIPFLGDSFKKSDMKLYDEMKKYAPITTIKEMGGFDIGNSGTLKDYVGYLETGKVKGKAWKKFQDALGVGAGFMDKLGWMTIWKSVKKEVATEGKYKSGSDAYFKACGERFERVIAKTQVYDSVNARSAYMRSQNDAVKYLVSFMGEPTTIAGMAEVAAIKYQRALASKNKNKISQAGAKLVATMAAIAASSALTDMAKSIIVALRDDDNDESYWEKYAQALGATFSDSMNPMNYFPVLRDIASIWDGFTTERPDIELIESAITSFKRTMKTIYDEDATSKEKLFAGVDTAMEILNLLGIPFKTIERDVRGIIRTISNIGNGYKSNLGEKFVEGVTGKSQNKNKKLYDAIVSGDDALTNYYRNNYDDNDSYNTALRKALRDNDERVQRIAMAECLGKYSESASLEREIISEGRFDKNVIVGKAIETEVNYVKDKLKEAKDYIKDGKEDEAKAIYKTLKKRGYTMEFIEAYLKKIS